MAKIKMNFVADIRGAVDGLVFSRGRTGAYVRNRTVPIDPHTTNQSNVRDRFAQVAANFQTLTSEAAEAWTQFAALVPQLNSFGDQYIPSGKQIYVQSNLNMIQIGQPVIESAPFGNQEYPSLGIGDATATLEITADEVSAFALAGLTFDASCSHMVIQATPPLNATKQSYRNRMREVFVGAATATPNLLSGFAAYFNGGAPVPATSGQIVNIRIRGINEKNGFSTAWYYLRAVAVLDEALRSSSTKKSKTDATA